MQPQYPHFEPYNLSPLDHHLPPMHLTFFLTFKPEDTTQALSTLESGLSKLLFSLPFLTGNVARVSQARGVRQLQPAVPALLDQYPMLKVKYHQKIYLPTSPSQSSEANKMSYDDVFIPLPLDHASNELSPAFRLQANVMEDGLILCATMHHTVMDGKGLTNVLEALSLCCQNVHTGARLVPFTTPAEQEAGRKHILEAGLNTKPSTPTQPDVSSKVIKTSVPLIPEVPITRRLVISNDKLGQLRDMCGSFGNDRIELSRNDIFAAVMWLCFMRARESTSPDPTDAKRKSTMMTVSDTRGIMRPALSDNYMGNAYSALITESPLCQNVYANPSPNSPVGQMQDVIDGIKTTDIKSVAQLAIAIRRDRNALDDEYIRTEIADVVHKTDWQPTFLEQCDYGQSSLRKFGLYDMDFGPLMGKISDFDIPDGRLSRIAWDLPARYANAPWELRIGLEPKVMENLRMDPLFRWVEAK
ncbi:hypothetical protein N7452_001372 [Penicillium brevicompactum]|uniref:Uncharacterized protein n=1 Tax=Penicillium brevicompactum TaxID=5074 RepID=A0A9W9R286_PENBR|nr:hypothetical protein N7452_001372 [Penicillium brevicompactum]